MLSIEELREASRARELSTVCECEHDIDPDELEDDWHYLRTCQFCGDTWWGLHCPHDGTQNPCMSCGKRPLPVMEVDYAL